MRTLRLGVYYHIPAYDKNGKIYLPGFFGRFVDSLAERCQVVTCFLHPASSEDAARCDYQLKASNIIWVNLGQAHSAPYRTFFSKCFTHKIVPYLPTLDIILLRGPSPLLPAIATAAGGLPVALLLVGDYLAGIDLAPQQFVRKELIRLWAWWNAREQLRVARHTLTIVNSHKLYEDLYPLVPNLMEIRTTTLNQDDFFERFDTCQSSSICLLYTGRLSVSKGLFDIIDAISILLAEGKNIRLEIAGWPEKGENRIVEDLIYYAAQKGVQDRVSYLGYKAMGPELFACYRNADLYVIASQSSFEGFPRTIWEAMANSLPVVATRVGSIPAFIDGLAEIVEPRQPAALAAGITRLLSSAELRQQYIQQGIALARQNTLEARTHELVSHIEEWIRRLS